MSVTQLIPILAAFPRCLSPQFPQVSTCVTPWLGFGLMVITTTVPESGSHEEGAGFS